MQYAEIPLAQLDISALNMRHDSKPPYIDDILPNIREKGIQQTLMVRRTEAGDRFEIVAGRRRYYAARTVADENGGEYAPLPCRIMEQDDDAAALEASLIENMARLDPDEMTQYETFARLVKEGRQPDQIAILFGITETAVKQRLALGDLIPQIRDAYRKDKDAIGVQTIRLLTMATKKQQRAWWKLFKSKDEYAPQGRDLKSWLFNGDDIRTDTAIFDLKDYKGKLAGDLFEDASYFVDPDQFWKLQGEAIAAKIESYMADGWSDVIVLKRGAYFREYDYEKITKKKGGHVYVVVGHSGEVEFREGYLTRREAQKQRRTEEKAKQGEPDQKPSRPEITNAMQNYLELHRHAAVSAELLGQRDVALRLVTAHLIAGSTLWQIEPELKKANKDITNESLTASKAMAAMNKERDAVFALLGMKPADTLIRHGWRGPSALEIYAKLWPLKTDEVVSVLTYAMAESLEVGSPLVEAIGKELNVDMADHWQPDDAFWTLLQGRNTVNAVLADIAGKTVADQNITIKLAAQKDIARDCLTGSNGRQKVEGWLPPYMRFPFQTYTSNGGTRIEEAVKKVEALKATD